MDLHTVRNLCYFEELLFTIHLRLVNIVCCNKPKCLFKSLQL